MNIPEDMRCEWTAGSVQGYTRCMCPATLSTSRFCVFHRHADEVDAAGIVAWSQEATAEDFIARAKAFTYRNESPTVRRLRAQIEAHKAGNPVGILSSRLIPKREPGQDDEDIAA